MKYTATSKSGMVVNKNDKREFHYGHFSKTLIDCDKCSWHCKKGQEVFEGMSKKKVNKSWQGCKSMKIRMEIVELVVK